VAGRRRSGGDDRPPAMLPIFEPCRDQAAASRASDAAA